MAHKRGGNTKARLVTHASTIDPSSHLYNKVMDPHHVGPLDHGTWL